ncbi:MAG: pyridoxal-phosphate dependent enzyme [Albidovulum sp.]
MIPSFADIARAYALTRTATQRTPLLRAESLERASGARAVFVKAENLQSAGSFKIRGATWRLACLSQTERKRGVIAYSSGNFAQGLAAAGRAQGVPVTIVMPMDAPALKRRATEGFGAKVVLSDHGNRPREEVASALAQSMAEAEGLVLLHPFDDPMIVAGQAGAGLEALEQLDAIGETVDLVACPVGGGGLLGGLALAFHYARPKVEVIGVEPEGFDGMGRSLARGALTRVDGQSATICDALQATRPGAAPFEAARFAGVKAITVPDRMVSEAMAASFEQLKLVLEPSGAVALAALLSGALPVAGKGVLIVASGGNIALGDFMAGFGPKKDEAE